MGQRGCRGEKRSKGHEKGTILVKDREPREKQQNIFVEVEVGLRGVAGRGVCAARVGGY